MSSDADYAAFLDKANQDTSSASTQGKTKSVGITAVNTEVPQTLTEVEEYFVSDSDEPFKPISLKYDGDKLPGAVDLGEMLGISLESINQRDFDARDQYKAVVEAVKKAGNGNADFFKAEMDRTRLQYIVVSLDTKHKRIVGLKASAVES